jgi:glycine/serine hydroxymethyltransferase
MAQEHKPKMIIGGFSAYSGIVDWAKMREIADSIGGGHDVSMRNRVRVYASGNQACHVRHIDEQVSADLRNTNRR